jgi:hypothetical protein
MAGRVITVDDAISHSHYKSRLPSGKGFLPPNCSFIKLSIPDGAFGAKMSLRLHTSQQWPSDPRPDQFFRLGKLPNKTLLTSRP